LIDIEDLTEDELQVLKKFYIYLSEKAEKDQDIFATHSIEEEAKGDETGIKMGEKKNPV